MDDSEDAISEKIQMPVAILINGTVISVPQILPTVSENAIMMTGNFTQARAEQLAQGIQKGMAANTIRPGVKTENQD